MKAAEEAPTLLQRARKVPVKSGSTYEVDPEIVEAAIAWLKGQVAGSQVATAWGVKQNQAESKLLAELKNAARAGKLKLEFVP